MSGIHRGLWLQGDKRGHSLAEYLATAQSFADGMSFPFHLYYHEPTDTLKVSSVAPCFMTTRGWIHVATSEPRT